MDFFNSLISIAGKLLVIAGIWIMLALGGLAADLTGKEVVAPPVQSVQTSATSTPAKQTAVASTTATSTPTKAPAKPVVKKPATPLPPAATPVVPAPPAVISNDVIQQTNTLAKQSLVNILCNVRVGNTFSYISGSGVIVDPRGVVLTNAHVAQFLLLQNYKFPNSTSCTIRTGSPAVASYTAELIYLPPLWVDANASQVLSDHAVGTGERDYAFLLITGAAQFASAPPPTFPALTIEAQNPTENEPVLLAAYPAGFLTGNDIQRNLYSSSAVSSIQKLYTFNSSDHVDLVSLGGTVVSQSGSSGGAVIDLTDGKLAAMIATESEGTTTASRDLRAITMFHVNQSLHDDGQGGIATLLSGDLAAKAQNFNVNVAPSLTTKLGAAIESSQ